MSSTSRGLAVLGSLSVLGLWSMQAHGDKQPVQAQQIGQVQVIAKPAVAPIKGQANQLQPGGKEDPDKPDDESLGSGITLPLDSNARNRAKVAMDYLKLSDWANAVYALQLMLNEKEDSFIEIEKPGPGGKMAKHTTSAKAEANRLLGSMPAEGLEVYELQHGARARQMVDDAKRLPEKRAEELQNKSTAEILADVSQRYLHTKAGAEAAELLGTHLLTRGQPVPAALCFDRLLERQKEGIKPLTLLKVAVAYHCQGDTERASAIWERLGRVAPGGIVLDDRKVPLNVLREEVERSPNAFFAAAASDWPLFKGDLSRTAEGKGSTPFLDDIHWKQPTLEHATVQSWVDTAVKFHESNQKSTPLPAFFPIAVSTRTAKGEKKLVIYRTYRCIQAVNIEGGKLEWEQVVKWSVEQMLKNNPSAKMQIDQWMQFYTRGGNQSVLFENSTVGTLSADNHCVYAVDDLALPPHPAWAQQFAWGGRPNLGALADIVNHNKLIAVELASGKLRWELGGTGEGALDDSYFLGPPLPLGGKLYILIEKAGQLRLVCLDAPQAAMAPPVINWSQPLAALQNPMSRDVGRRMHAANLAYGDGVLVCPTNAGAVLGVDLLTHSLVWVYHYDRTDTGNDPNDVRFKRGFNQFGQQQASFSTDWKNSAPIVQSGKVVFTSPDGTAVHCVSLRDGTLVWKKNRADDLYIGGVHNGKVLLVGRNSCRALKLDTGDQLWSVETGVPSGQGVASDGVYYLPLKAAAQTKEPEICSIEINTGKIARHTRSRKPAIPSRDAKQVVPGNLVFFEGKVVSQNIYEIQAFKQLKVKLEEMNAKIAQNPQDPFGLTERAELRRNDGDLTGAIADLRLALANKPNKEVELKARGLLYDSLTEAFQHDFAKNEQHLDEYRELCKIGIPDGASPEVRRDLLEEQQRRQANFLCLLAKGREHQGKLVDAFRHYVEFGALGDKAGLLTVIDEPTVKARPDIWAQGRIAAMMAKANAEQRRPLEEEITRQWRELQGNTSDLAKLRNFVVVFGNLSEAGSEARLQLAQRIIESSGGPHSVLEAELHLMQVRNHPKPELAAKAIELLARLMTKQNQLEDAAYWINILAQQYPKVQLGSGKTGADYLNELATDKRFLPYLDEAKQLWTGTDIKFRDTAGHFPQVHQVFHFEPEGEIIPFYKRHSLAFNRNLFQIKLIDRQNNEEKWSRNLSRQNPNNLSYLFWNQNNMQVQNFRFNYSVQGHLAVFQVGLRIYGFDLVEKEVLWEHTLLTDDATMPVQQIVPNPQGGLNVIFADGRIESIGQRLPVEAGFVCVQGKDGMMALDPLTGTPLWTKSDVNSWTHAFGDSERLYLVEVRRDGSIGNARALRARDGVSVPVNEFSNLYQNKVGLVGRNIVIKDNDAQGKLQIRLYDVQTGKDVWKRSFDANAVVCESENPNFVGVIEPDQKGKLTVIDLKTQKEVLAGAIDPKDIEKAQQVHLLNDAELFYVAVNGPPEANLGPWAGPWINLINGMRGIKVNGMVYAYDAASQRADKVHWKSIGPVVSQVLVLEQFNDIPMLLFCSRAQRIVNNQNVQVTETLCIAKKTGKIKYKVSLPNNGTQFHSLNINPRAGTVELVSYNKKIEFYMEK